jgi:putative copper resistance protein D
VVLGRAVVRITGLPTLLDQRAVSPTTNVLPPLTLGRFVGDWHFDPWTAGFVVIALLAYGVGLRAARRRDVVWPWWRTASFLTLGLGLVVVATMSSIAIYSRVLLWPMALQVSLLVTIVPVGIGLGDPIGLVSHALSPAGAARWQGVLRTWPVRLLTFPAVSPVLAVATQFVVFFSGYIGAAEHHGWVLHLLQLQLVLTGCLFALPLLGVEVLPVWCTQPVRMMVAGIDGLLDAVPGIAVLTSRNLVASGYYGTVPRTWGPTRSWDQTIGGGLLLTVAEVVAVPFIAILFRAWIKEDARNAKVIDQALDAQDVRRKATAPASLPDEAMVQRPWWETNPGPLADRAARYGWASEEPREPGE